MKIKAIISSVGLLFFFSSCILIASYTNPSGFTYKYDGRYTGIDTLINVDGYYQSDSIIKVESTGISYTYKFMFYRDGLCCMTISDAVKSFQTGEYPVRWGTYILAKGIIKTQIIADDFGTGKRLVCYYNFKIINGNQIKMISSGTSLKKEMISSNMRSENLICLFHPLESRIDSTNHFLKRKWFHKRIEEQK
ncbi:MAG: hypothetical protein ACLVKO_09730 [Dysgonomonas sp.]